MKRVHRIYLHYSSGRSILLFLLVVEHSAELVVPFLFGALVALLASGSADAHRILCLASLIVILNGLSILAEYLFRCRVAQETAAMATELKTETLRRFNTLDYECRERRSTGEWEQRIGGDSQSIASCSCPVISDLYGGVVMFILTAAMMLWGQSWFLLPIVMIGGLFWYVYRVNVSLLNKRSREMRECSYREFNTLLDTLSLMPIMRLFQVVPFLSRRYDAAAGTSKNAEIALARTSARYTGQIRGLMWITSGIALGLSLLLYMNGKINVEEVVAYDLLVSRVTAQLGQLVFCIPMLTRAAESIDALESVFGSYTEKYNSEYTANHEMEQVDELLRLEAVSFRYQDGNRYILSQVNWIIPRGSYISILGRNGEGKSTLIKLLLGELRPTSGRVAGSMKRPGYVPQVSAVFRGSLLDNLVLCNRKISRKDVEHIVRLTRLQPLCKRVGGLDGDICREQISGGELQRIGIARALLISPDLLVVDEITNNLDIANKTLIFRMLRELKHKCSIISISHDIETLSDSDECLFLSNGHLRPLKGNTTEERRQNAYKLIEHEYGEDSYL